MQMSIYLAAWSKAFIILKDAAALRRSGRENSTLYRPLVDLMAAVKDVATLMEMKNGADSSLINTATANGKKHF
jgi:protein required for attachment to host cells